MTRAIDRLVTLSAWTSRIMWSCQPLTARAARVGRSAEQRARDSAAWRSWPSPASGASSARAGSLVRPSTSPASAANCDPAQVVVVLLGGDPVQQGDPGRVAAPAPDRFLRGLAGDRDDQRLDAGAQRALQRAGPGLRAPLALAAGLPAPGRLQAAEQLAGAGEVLPAGQRLAAQQRAVGQRLVRFGQRRPRRRLPPSPSGRTGWPAGLPPRRPARAPGLRNVSSAPPWSGSGWPPGGRP